MDEPSLIDIDDDMPKVKPSERGWDKPEPLDYEALQAKPEAFKIAEDGEQSATKAFGTSEWASSAQKYEWKEEYGDVAPEFPELEKHLYTGDLMTKMGEHMVGLTEFTVTQESDTKTKPIDSVSPPPSISSL